MQLFTQPPQTEGEMIKVRNINGRLWRVIKGTKRRTNRGDFFITVIQVIQAGKR